MTRNQEISLRRTECAKRMEAVREHEHFLALLSKEMTDAVLNPVFDRMTE